MLLEKSKYFIAIVFNEPLQNALTQLKTKVADTFQSKGALRSPAHITLQMPFEWDEKKKVTLHETLKNFASQQTNFDLELKDFDYFEPRVVFVNVLDCPALKVLQAALQNHLKQSLHIFENDGKLRGFHPHVTIGFRDLKKQQFFEAKKYFLEQTFYSVYTCNNISLLKHTGNIWEVEATFSFTL
jgi:2'-5' RNA ligase